MRYAFWIASWDYIEEAQRSCERFRELMPDIETHLFYFSDSRTTEPQQVFGHLHNIGMRTHRHWYLDSVYAMDFAMSDVFPDHANTIYFDTDTWLAEPVYELYELMDHGFEFFAAHAPGRMTGPTVHAIPPAFPEFNIGVCGFRNTFPVSDLMRQWYRNYFSAQDIYGNNDQSSLRETLWNGRNLRYCAIPSEYNCRFGFGVHARLPVKILHGRHPDLQAVANSINKEKGFRVWTLASME